VHPSRRIRDAGTTGVAIAVLADDGFPLLLPA